MKTKTSPVNWPEWRDVARRLDKVAIDQKAQIASLVAADTLSRARINALIKALREIAELRVSGDCGIASGIANAAIADNFAASMHLKASVSDIEANFPDKAEA